MRRKLSVKDTVAIVKRILAGEDYVAIAKDFKVTHSMVSFIGQDLGLVRRNSRQKHLKWDARSIDAFLFQHNSTIRRISTSIMNCRTYMTWRCTLCGNQWEQTFGEIKSRIEKRPDSAKGCPDCGQNEFTVYHDFLDKVNSYNAYFIGAFMARGRKLKPNKIAITSNDREQLEKLADLIACTYPVKEVKGTKKVKTFILEFRSTKIASKLPKGRKYPTNIRKYIKDFLRGYTDFKGYYEYKPDGDESGCPHSINIFGDTKMLEMIKGKYEQYYAKSKFKDTKLNSVIRPSYKRYQIRGLEACYVYMEWIYNSKINPLRYIARSKFNTYLELKEKVNQKKILQKYMTQTQKDFKQLKSEFRKTLTYTQIAKKYKLSIDQIKGIAVRCPESINKDLKKEIQEAIEKRRHTKKHMNELKTRFKNKTGIELRIEKTTAN